MDYDEGEAEVRTTMQNDVSGDHSTVSAKGSELSDEWTQRGFAVISWAGPLPLLHGFFLPKWEAENELRRIRTMSVDLKVGLCIVDARLTFMAKKGQEDA